MAYIEHEVRVGANGPAERITRLVESRPRRMWYRSLAALPPQHLPGLQLHLDAQALALGDGAAVASWPDLSPNAVPFTQSDPALQPIVAAAGINGKRSVRFNGSAQTLTAATGPGTRPDSGMLHLFLVMANGSRADYEAASVLATSGITPFGRNDNTWYIFGNGYGFHGGFVATVLPPGSADTIGGVSLQMPPAPRVYEVAYDAQVLSAWQDGAFVGSDDVVGGGGWSDAILAIGAAGFGPFIGEVGEIVMFDRALSEQERLGVTAYLLDRWQLVD